MQRVQSSTAYHDVTYNNVKASRASMNDIYSQSVTKITSDRENPIEVFSTLTRLETLINSSRATLETRINELVAENTRSAQKITELEARLNDLVTE